MWKGEAPGRGDRAYSWGGDICDIFVGFGEVWLGRVLLVDVGVGFAFGAEGDEFSDGFIAVHSCCVFLVLIAVGLLAVVCGCKEKLLFFI